MIKRKGSIIYKGCNYNVDIIAQYAIYMGREWRIVPLFDWELMAYLERDRTMRIGGEAKVII